MKPNHIIEEIHRRRECRSNPAVLNIYWVASYGDRDELANTLRNLRGDFAIVPLVLRSLPGRFKDSNALMNDVLEVLEHIKKEILDLARLANKNNMVEVLIISRTELRLTSTSSPIELPEWFPIASGLNVTAHVIDLTWNIDVSMADDVVEREELCRILYQLDLSMIARLIQCREIDHRQICALWDALKFNDTEQKVTVALDDIVRKLNDVRNPSRYRPSTTKNPSLVSRIWRRSNSTSPDQLPKIAAGLSTALMAKDLVRDQDYRQSILATLNRPSNLVEDRVILWSYQLILAIRSACQLITSSAHADEYPNFPYTLLKATSLDLRLFLDDATRIVTSGTNPNIARTH